MRPGIDCPDEHELRAIANHPLTRKLNRELIACLERWWQRLEKEKENGNANS